MRHQASNVQAVQLWADFKSGDKSKQTHVREVEAAEGAAASRDSLQASDELEYGERTMVKQMLGTFPTRDVADSVKDAFLEDGFPPENLIVMTNADATEPPEAAKLEVGREGEGGFKGIEEKIGKSVRQMFGQKDRLNGDLSEGGPTTGALLAVTVSDDLSEAKARQLFAFHRAADVEFAQEH